MISENVTVADQPEGLTGRPALKALLNRLRTPTARRTIPPSREYAAALAEARETGRSAYAVDLEFLARQGWTREHERQFLHNVQVLAFGDPTRFFKHGHAPESLDEAMAAVV